MSYYYCCSLVSWLLAANVASVVWLAKHDWMTVDDLSDFLALAKFKARKVFQVMSTLWLSHNQAGTRGHAGDKRELDGGQMTSFGCYH